MYNAITLIGCTITTLNSELSEKNCATGSNEKKKTFFLVVVVVAVVAFVVFFLAESHVEAHHDDESQHGACRGPLPVAFSLRFRNDIVDNDVNHSTGREGQRVRQQRLENHDDQRPQNAGKGLHHAA